MFKPWCLALLFSTTHQEVKGFIEGRKRLPIDSLMNRNLIKRPATRMRPSELEVSDPRSAEELFAENLSLKKRVQELESREKSELMTGFIDDVEVGDWCELTEDPSEEVQCEPETSEQFFRALRSRVTWLVGLLAAQSMSSSVLSSNMELIERYPSIVFFLTMLVGAGGNAGNQAAVRIIRGLATESITPTTKWQFLGREVKMAFCISILVAMAGAVRVVTFGTPAPETVALTLSLYFIVFIAIVAGAALPLLLDALKFDAAHASTTIQVVMDITGVILVCLITRVLLDGSLATMILAPTSL